MKENYTYPAVADFADPDYVEVSFPDFDVITCVDAEEDYIAAAQDLLALTVADYEDRGEEPPTSKAKPILDSKQELIYINVWMPYHRTAIRETYTKKTLTVPTWLDILAKKRNLNFSAVLSNALKEELGITGRNQKD